MTMRPRSYSGLPASKQTAMLYFHNFKDVNKYLNNLMPEARSRKRAYNLSNMRRLMAFLGNPQNSYRIIHVAGTSGKSSTCYFLSSLLRAAGQKVGLTVSPHVYGINERVQINTRPLAEKQFCEEFAIFLDEIGPSGVTPTYFEILVAFSFWEFARQGVEYAVVEVGLGGLLDGTNVVDRADKVCVITDIGLDHTSTLGGTIAEIAYQKAGIILPGNTVFSYRKSGDAGRVLREVCDERQASLNEIDETGLIGKKSDMPLFQQRNWQLAHAVFLYIASRDKLRLPAELKLLRTLSTYIPARMEILRYKGKILVFDGAHNSQKMEYLVRSLISRYPNRRIAGIVSMVQSSPAKVRDSLRVLLPALSYMVITDFSASGHVRNATNSQIIMDQCQKLGYTEGCIVPDPMEALQSVLNRKEEIILVVGSLFLPSAIRPYIESTRK